MRKPRILMLGSVKNEAKLKQMLKEKGVDVPPDAKLVKRTVTDKFETFVFQHISGSYIVDSDRIIVKISKSGNPGVLVPVRDWRENLPPPPPTPLKMPSGKARPVLINPDNPFYRWEEGKKPVPLAPCFIVQKGADLTIIDAVSGEVIGKGTPAP